MGAVSVVWTENVDELFASQPDVVVEVIGGIEPVGGWVRRALQQGAAVVTANKQLLAAHGPELLAPGGHQQHLLRFEAAVGGGVPLIHGVREGLAGDNLNRVSGHPQRHVQLRPQPHGGGGDETMSAVLDDARKLGYAEADPSADIDGDDAGAKLVVLAGIAFRRHLKLSDIPRATIRPISAADFRYARKLGCTIRQISMVELRGDGFSRVRGAALVARGSNFRSQHGRQQRRDDLGAVRRREQLQRRRRRRPATAVAVVSDLLALTQRDRDHGEEWRPGTLVAALRDPITCGSSCRTPGIIASIASALAREAINLDALLQEPGYPKDNLPFVITVEACEESALAAALKDITREDFHAEQPLALPMLLGDDSRT
jgi:homoserine dehydrogenase